MISTPRAFRAAVWIGWVMLGAAGVVYAAIKHIPVGIAVPLLLAILIEYPFFLLPAFPALRERLQGTRLTALLVSSTVLPYLVCCAGAIAFDPLSLLKLAAVPLVLGAWYLILPAHVIADLAFLASVAAILLSNFFKVIYPKPFPGADVAILGHLALIQIAVLVLMVHRKAPDGNYGFLPSAREWKVGALYYLGFLPLGFPLAYGIGLIHYRGPAPLWQIAGTFLGFLWVVALSEEYFFRGVLQAWMEKWCRNRIVALVVTSILFGSVHLWYAHRFPNWRQSLLAALMGLFCGLARNRCGGSIRSAMVTHALVVTTWRGFFV
jgi:uncharacterized protein